MMFLITAFTLFKLIRLLYWHITAVWYNLTFRIEFYDLHSLSCIWFSFFSGSPFRKIMKRLCRECQSENWRISKAGPKSMYLGDIKNKNGSCAVIYWCCPKNILPLQTIPKKGQKTLAKRICLNMLCRFINTKLHNLIQETKYLFTTDWHNCW